MTLSLIHETADADPAAVAHAWRLASASGARRGFLVLHTPRGHSAPSGAVDGETGSPTDPMPDFIAELFELGGMAVIA